MLEKVLYFIGLVGKIDRGQKYVQEFCLGLRKVKSLKLWPKKLRKCEFCSFQQRTFRYISNFVGILYNIIIKLLTLNHSGCIFILQFQKLSFNNKCFFLGLFLKKSMRNVLSFHGSTQNMGLIFMLSLAMLESKQGNFLMNLKLAPANDDLHYVTVLFLSHPKLLLSQLFCLTCLFYA